MQDENQVTFKIITNPKDLDALKDTWSKVFERTRDSSIPQSWEWQRTWWGVYGGDRDLYVYVGYVRNKPIGIAPFSTSMLKTRYFNFLPYRTLWYLCAGKTDGRNVASDYSNFIVLKGKEKPFLFSLLKRLGAVNNWDEIIITDVSSESVIPDLLHGAAKEYKLYYEITNTAHSILIKLPNSWDEYVKSVGRNFRYKINRGRKEFKKIGGTYHLVNKESDIPRAFLDLEALHQRRWQGKGERGAFACPKWRKFHQELIPLLFKNGWLRLSFLKIDGEPVAANYSFVFDGKVHFFQSGIVPHENKHIRLGLILHSYCIEEAINEGFQEYDFLKYWQSGSEYKKMWGNYSRELLDIRISKPTNKESLYRRCTTILNFIKHKKHMVEHKLNRLRFRPSDN